MNTTETQMTKEAFLAKYNLGALTSKPHKQAEGELIVGTIKEFGFTDTKKHGTLEFMVLINPETNKEIKLWVGSTLKNALEFNGVVEWPSEDDLINNSDAAVKVLNTGIIGIERMPKKEAEVVINGKPTKTMINEYTIHGVKN